MTPLPRDPRNVCDTECLFAAICAPRIKSVTSVERSQLLVSLPISLDTDAANFACPPWQFQLGPRNFVSDSFKPNSEIGHSFCNNTSRLFLGNQRGYRGVCLLRYEVCYISQSHYRGLSNFAAQTALMSSG